MCKGSPSGHRPSRDSKMTFRSTLSVQCSRDAIWAPAREPPTHALHVETGGTMQLSAQGSHVSSTCSSSSSKDCLHHRGGHFSRTTILARGEATIRSRHKDHSWASKAREASRARGVEVKVSRDRLA